jgi:alkylated DNA repair dioxygenase AlkB
VEQLSWLAPASEPSSTRSALPEGARFISDFISGPEESRLITLIDSAPWLDDLKRRVQHYGYRYDYKKRQLTADDFLGPLPHWATVLGERLVSNGIFHAVPDQVIVNEYEPGQGIASHVDRETCFGEVVASLSLGGIAVMELSLGTTVIPVELVPRSLLSLQGPARHRWRHGIPARRRDLIGGHLQDRSRRVSLTFRTVLTE